VRVVAVAFSDIHCGHKMGLMNPDTELPDMTTEEPALYKPRPTLMQKWLWENYTKGIEGTVKLANGDPIVILFNGDATWGIRHPEGIISTRMSDQCHIAAMSFVPWFEHKNVKSLWMVYGTQSHEFGEGSGPELICAHLRPTYPEVKIKTLSHGLLDVEGMGIDIAHHGPTTGSRTWLKGNTLRYYMKSSMLADLADGSTPPRIYIRSHYHEYVEETVTINTAKGQVRSIGFVTPAFCGLTHYARQVTRSSHMLGCGMVAMEIVDGELRGLYPSCKAIDLRTKENVL